MLKGRSLNLSVEVVGGDKIEFETKEYEIKLVDKYDDVSSLFVIGIEKISSKIENINFGKVYELFGIPKDSINRPQSGEIDLLIGVRYAGFHPTRIASKNHLLLLENRFGKIIQGIHPEINETTTLDSRCMQIKHAIVMHVCDSSFNSIENLGVNCVPKCGSCKCGKCHPGGKDMSLKDEKELELIEQGLKFDLEKKRWVASYPWLKNPSVLENNRDIVYKILLSTERRLLRNHEHASIYSRQIQDMIDRGAARKVTREELDNYKGTKYYIAHHGVFKPESTSTPLRIVFNTSAVYGNVSLNDCLAKGPSLLNNLLGVLMRFRSYKFAFVGDIKKMYHSIDIPVEDQMTHLFLWRKLDLTREPDTYSITVVNMGDRPSATIAQSALRKTAMEFEDRYPSSSSIVIKNSYMDDVPGGDDSKESGKKRMKEIEEMLASKGFRMKEWMYSGMSAVNTVSKDQKDVQMLFGLPENDNKTNGVLGMKWNANLDSIQFFVHCKYDSSTCFTKRSMLSVINSIYDPLGLITPFTIRAKIIMRMMWATGKQTDWDDKLPKNVEIPWKSFIDDMKYLNELRFPRSISVPCSYGNPSLVIFSDGSGEAYGAVAYVRWKISEEKYCSRIHSAKSRMAPIKLIDTVRLELCGSTLAVRLRKTILLEGNLEFDKVIHIIDSEIVQAMIHRESYGFNTFAGNRLGEIQRDSEPNEWAWIESKLNIADILTRGCHPEDLSPDTVWQNGPSFLENPEDTWPVNFQVHSVTELPELKNRHKESVLLARKTKDIVQTLCDYIKIERFSKWKLLIGTTARILKLYKKYKRNVNDFSVEILPDDLRKSTFLWIEYAQRDIDMKKCVKLSPRKENGIIYVGSRTERWNMYTWNQQCFILLPKNSPISFLIAIYEHNKSHLGIDYTISKIRSQYWIIGIRSLVKGIISNCVPCQIKLKNTLKQVMSTLPVERLKPCPAFSHVAVDYFGPFESAGEVQRRVKRKCYGVIFVCLTVGAVYVDLASDYTTDSFLQVLRRFTCIHGWPNTIHSDKGSNLVGASNLLKKVVQELEWENISKTSALKGTKWNFSPADAKWYNGLAESLVKSVKRALSAALGDSNNHMKLRFSEMLTVMFESAQLVNERPIGRHPSNPDERYLCPNDLLLGRSSAENPQEEFQNICDNNSRFQFIQKVVTAFWKRWVKEAFPNLVIQKKWHTESRNLGKGDIVLVQELNAVRGKWKRAIVTEVIESGDKKVRRVMIRYKSEAGLNIEVERPIQKLILLVPNED